jgi:hypothetical protein
MCPGRAGECFAPAGRSNAESANPAFAGARRDRGRARRSGHEDQQDRDADRQAGQPQQPDLAIAHLQRPLEHPPPGSGIEERQQAFEDQHQRDRAGEQEGHRYFFLAAEDASAAPAPPEPRIALKKSELVSITITSDFLLKLAR